jgi:protein-tyrosine-phosphatase
MVEKEIMNTISVVCRANEVRSRVVQAYLMHRFPKTTIRSYGIEIDKKGAISRRLINSMKNWGLEIHADPPVDFYNDLDFIENSDFVIAADSHIASEILGNNRKVFDLTKYALDDSHVPADPLGYDTTQMLINNAKVIHCTFRLLNEFNSDAIHKNMICAAIPKESNPISYENFEGYVIDARLKHYEETEYSNKLRLKFSQEMLMSGQLESMISSEIFLYTPMREFHRPEETLLSRRWLDFIEKISKNGPTVVITTPRSSPTMDYPDSYLTSVLASAAKYI